MKITIKLAILLVCILIAGISCKKENVDLSKISNTVNWDPKLAVPIGYGDYSLKNFYESQNSEGVVKEYPDNLLFLTYRTEIISKTAEELIVIPNQSFQEFIQASDAGFPIFGTSTSISYTRNSSYSFTFTNNEEIDSVYIKAGTLALNIQSTFHNTGTVRVTIPTLKLNGVPMQINININTATGTYNYNNPPVSLAGYKLYLPKVAGVPNKIPLTYEVTLTKSGTNVSSTDRVTVTTQVQQLKFQSLFGFLSTYNFINYSDKIEMDLFNADESSIIDFNNPQINLFLKNSCGVPVQLSISNTRTYTKKTNSYFAVTLTPSSKLIRYPVLAEIGQTKFDTLKYNKTTSNFPAALQTTPQYFYYTIGASSNPASLGKTVNFVEDTSKLTADLEVELPLDLKSNRFEIIDTMDFDLSDIIGDYSILKKLVLHNKFENGMPFELTYQLFLTDDNYNTIDSVFRINQQPILPSGVVGTEGKVTSSTTKELQIEFTGTRINNFKNVKKAIYKLALKTYNNGQTYVKFYSTDRLKVWFGIQADFEIHSLDQI